MRALGNVNHRMRWTISARAPQGAVQLCREQKDDLETAQTDLHKVIDQLTVGMKEIFRVRVRQ